MYQSLVGFFDSSMFQTLFSNFLGALITWLVAKRYYEKASRDLYDEVDELKRLSILMLRAQELNSDTELFGRDNRGMPSGIVHDLSANAVSGSATSSASLTKDKG